MEKVQELAAKIKKLSTSFEKEVEDIFKTLSDSGKKLQVDLKYCTFMENVMQSNMYLCEMKCIVLQMRHDLHNLKEETEKNNNKNKKAEKEKLILLLYNAEEVYGQRKAETITILVDIMEKRNKMKFTLSEVETWREMHTFINVIVMRMSI